MGGSGGGWACALVWGGEVRAKPPKYYGVVQRNAHTSPPLRSTKMSTIHVAMVFLSAGTRDTLENDGRLIFAVICTAYMVYLPMSSSTFPTQFLQAHAHRYESPMVCQMLTKTTIFKMRFFEHIIMVGT